MATAVMDKLAARVRLQNADEMLDTLRQRGVCVGKATLGRWGRVGRIPVVRINARHYLYDAEKVMSALNLLDSVEA